MKNKYNWKFPPPKLLQPPSVGVDISDNSIKYIEIGRGKTGLEVLRFGEEQIPEGVIKGGEINNKKKFNEIIKNFIEKVPSNFYRISLPEEKAYLFSMPIPFDAGTNPRMAIELSLEKYVPIKAINSIFDYKLIGQKDGNFMVHVSVVPKNIVEEYFSPFEESGKVVLSMELEIQAAANASLSKNEKDTTTMLIDIGLTRTSIAIISNRIVVFSISINIGGQSMTERIKQEFNVSQEEAEKLKIEHGMVIENNNYKELPSIMVNQVAVLKDEINKIFSYWDAHNDELVSQQSKIERLLICGGASKLKGLRDYFNSGLDIPVEYVNPWVNVNSLDEYIPSISKDKSLSFTSAIGLVLHTF